MKLRKKHVSFCWYKNTFTFKSVLSIFTIIACVLTAASYPSTPKNRNAVFINLWYHKQIEANQLEKLKQMCCCHETSPKPYLFKNDLKYNLELSGIQYSCSNMMWNFLNMQYSTWCTVSLCCRRSTTFLPSNPHSSQTYLETWGRIKQNKFIK